MKRNLLTMITILLFCHVHGEGHVNLDSLYRVLDAAIDSADIFLQKKDQEI